MTPAPSDPRLERCTLAHTPLDHCTACGERAWRRVCLVAGTGGGFSFRGATFRECGCGRVEMPPAAPATPPG